MAHNKSVEAALVAWVKTFPLESQVNSLADLSDGFVLSKMLEDFDPAYAIHDLERNAGPSKWPSKKKSLEAVYRGLLRFTTTHCDGLDSLTINSNIDFNAIAEHNDTQEMVKFLTIFLMAAVKNPNSEKYVVGITTKLGESTQAEIMNIIKQHSAVSIDEPGAAPPQTSATDLALEEKHATLVSEHRKLKTRHETLITKHEHINMMHEQLKEDYAQKDSQLRSLQDLQDGHQEGFIKDLQRRIQENENLIAQQEHQLEEYRIFKEKQQRELTSLRPAADRLKELEDEFKMMKSENESLTKKANMVDHYRGKLEISTAVERENASLRERIDILQGNQKEYDQVHAENDKLRNMRKEYEKMFSSQEGEITSLAATSKMYKEDARAKQIEIDNLKARQTADEGFIEELQQQLRSGNHAPLSPNSPGDGPGNLTLQEELEGASDPTPNYLLEISRLKAENSLLKSGNAGTTNATLRTDLEESERARQRLSENLKDLTDQHAILNSQLGAILATSSNEKYVQLAIDEALKAGPLKLLTDDFYRDKAIASTRELERKATEELKATKAKLADVQTELTSLHRQLLAAKADLAAIDREEIDALEDLKETNEIITSSLNNDLQLVQSRHKNLIIDYDQQRAHLVDALLDRENLRKELEVAKRGRLTIDPESVEDNGKIAEADAAEEKAKAASQALKEQSEKQEVIIQDLQRRLKSAEEVGPEAQKAANEALIKNLTRENSMIATAWYDLSSRLQSNHLVLQRRQDMPKSWLSKQRLMVNATPRR